MARTMALFLRYTSCFIFLLLLSTTARGENRLHKFVSHFEPVQYDHGTLMNEHHRVRRTIHGERHIDLQFKALGRHFNLRLKPDRGDVFHDNVQLFLGEEEYPKSEIKSLLYTGVDLNDPTAKVYGNLAYGVFDGFIHSKEDFYVVEPAERFPHIDAGGAHSVIYRHSDVDMDEMEHSPVSTCGATSRDRQRRMASFQSSGHVRRQSACSNQRNPMLVRCWLNVIADYRIYSEITSGSTSARMAQIVSTITTAIKGASMIYESTDFDGIGGGASPNGDNIQFGIERFLVNSTTPPSSSSFSREFLGVEAYLQAHSRANWGTYCLSYAFTSRDFDNGVLGLAFVASREREGGICSDFSNGRTLNTGVVTVTNFGQRVPAVVTMLTFAHEAGHNFGSGHDPQTAECAPSTGGNYIMFASASSGNQPNNVLFSPCSRRVMYDIIRAEGQDTGCGCFREAGDLCGNGIVDEGEECDCLSSDVNSNTMLCNTDPCCNGTSCMVANGRICSPQQGPCCNSSTCQLISPNEEFECRTESECALNQTCNGSSAACPVPEARVPVNGTNIQCNNGENYCVNGQCIGTICVPLNLTDCECTERDLQCHICCVAPNGTCVSSRFLTGAQTQQRTIVRVGFPCSNFTGYCDFLNNCRIINSDGALRRIAQSIFGSQIFTNAIDWIVNMWWAVALIGVGILIVLFLIVLGCHLLLPRPEHVKRRTEERKRRRQQRQAGLAEEHQMHQGHFRS